MTFISRYYFVGIGALLGKHPKECIYANQALPSDRIDVSYATIFPSMTILKIVCVQVAISIFGTG